MVDGAVLVLDGFETGCVVVATCAGADVPNEFSVDDDGPAVTASVARELELHAVATSKTPINIVATMDDCRQPSRRREVNTPRP
ncbi:MAG: hypothetical protein ABI706_10900 [Ilumatobacteraceae bacterium]